MKIPRIKLWVKLSIKSSNPLKPLIFTHLFAPKFGEMNLFGIEELLTYHYLVDELFRYSQKKPEQFWKVKKWKSRSRLETSFRWKRDAFRSDTGRYHGFEWTRAGCEYGKVERARRLFSFSRSSHNKIELQLRRDEKRFVQCRKSWSLAEKSICQW